MRIDVPTASTVRCRGLRTGSFEERRYPVLQQLHALISSFRADDDGQGLAEYALILSLIAIVAIIALVFLGTQVSNILSDVGNSV
jgi:pilus assembly protein Flp/PilA